VPKNDELFRKTIRVAFEQRRKTLPNALQAGFSSLSKEDCIAAVERAGLRPDIRGERLTMENFVTLADILDEMLAKR
jgi:16S rRNA (adenine1518-N6/adenine1519-N6)-dimethyltransferase